MNAANLPVDSAERLHERREYYRLYRLILLARTRRPLDFLVEPAPA
jgi:hypothetical protein